jgi:hypothetical protein
MDQRLLQLAYRVEHQHSDGSWGEMTEVRPAHDSAEHDPERSWSLRRIYRCEKCREVVTLTPGEDTPTSDE